MVLEAGMADTRQAAVNTDANIFLINIGKLLLFGLIFLTVLIIQKKSYRNATESGVDSYIFVRAALQQRFGCVICGG